MPSAKTSRRIASVARELRDNVSTDWRTQGPYQWASVAAIHPTLPFSTLDVYLDSSPSSPGATLALKIPYLNGYNPTIGDIVLVGRMAGAARTQRVILGPLESTLHGQTQSGEYSGSDYIASGIVGLTNPANSRWLGRWSYAGPPQGTFPSQIGDWGYDSNFIEWTCIAPAIWKSFPTGIFPGCAQDVSNNFTGIGATETDLVGYTGTATIPPGRAIRVWAYIPSLTSSVAGDFGSLRLYQDGAPIQRVDKQFASIALGQDQQTVRILVPPAGVHVYKATYQRTGGTGTFTSFAGGSFTVEDLGGSTLQFVLQTLTAEISSSKGTLS
jgi:hypothetical protein